MLLSAAASRRFCSWTRPSTKAPARLVLKIAVAMPAIASASDVGESANALITRVGSGTTSTAPMAVKWCETIASVSSSAAAKVQVFSVRRAAMVSAAMPSSMPSAIETITSCVDQTICPGNSTADMPV